MPVAEIDHATTPLALTQQTNRNSRRDKRLRAPSQRNPRQSSLSGQDRTVTYCTEIKGTPIYTLLGTARLSAINPQLYLRHVLERIADHPINRIDELLPWVVAPQLRPAWQEEPKAA